MMFGCLDSTISISSYLPYTSPSLSFLRSNPFQLWDVRPDQSQSEQGEIRRIKASGNIEEEATDNDATNKVGGPFIDISGTRLSQNYTICPPLPTTSTTTRRPSLGITLPHLYLTVHVPQQSDFSFEVTILDDKQTIRRFRASTYQSGTVIKSDICTIPLKLEGQHRWLKRDALLLPEAKKQKVQQSTTEYDDSYDNSSSYYGPGINAEECDDDEYDNGGSSHDKISCWNRLYIPLAEYTRRAYGTTYVETMWVQIHANCRLKRVYFAEKEVNEDDELPEEFRLFTVPLRRKRAL